MKSGIKFINKNNLLSLRFTLDSKVLWSEPEGEKKKKDMAIEYIDTQEAAELLGMTRWAILMKIKRKTFNVRKKKVSGVWMISKNDVLKMSKKGE